MPGAGSQRSWREEEAHIRRLIGALGSLADGELAVSMLVACGAPAVPYLAAFLLEGRPSSVAEPRRRAVRALAELGAAEVLLQYLEQPKDHLDPVLRMAEEEVESLAAESLSRWDTDDVFRALMHLASQRMLLGLCVAFGRMGRMESLPVLVHALGNDMCSVAAAEAILTFGKRAIPALQFAAGARELMQDRETPSSTKRRLAALRLLRSLLPAQELWSHVHRMAQEEDPRIAATACLAGLEAATGQDRELLAMRLLPLASQVDWFIQGEISEGLAGHFGDVRSALEACAADPAGDPISRRIAHSLLHREATRHPGLVTPGPDDAGPASSLLRRLLRWTSAAGNGLRRGWRRLAG
jgi:hypothetical protein